MFVYDTDGRVAGRRGTPFNPDNFDATDQYLKHVENVMTLDFLFTNSESRAERAQIENELTIGRRKMAYWEKQRNFDRDRMLSGMEKLKRRWER